MIYLSIIEKGEHKTNLKIEKRKIGENEPYAVDRYEGNVFLNSGIDNIWTLVAGGTATAYDNTNARIGVGDSSGAEDATQTGLQGTSTAYAGMNSGYPNFGTNQQIVFRSTFSGADANFSWEEITIDNGSVNLDRLVQSLGTKASGTEWTAELQLSIE